MSDLSITREFETGTLCLSEAMRLGARMRPQGSRLMFDGYGTCALGAVAEARGWIPKSIGDDGHLFLTDVPGTMNHPDSLFCQIGTMNDNGMSREEIADWLQAQGY